MKNVRNVASNRLGSGRIDIAATSTPVPLSDGVIALDTASMTATTIAFVAETTTTGPTLTDSGSGFVAAGFEDGMSIVLNGSTSNDGSYSIKHVGAGVIELQGETNLTAEVAGDTVTIYERPTKVEQVKVHCPSGNTSDIFVGGPNVSSASGMTIVKGTTETFNVNNLENMYVGAGTNGDDAHFTFTFTR